MTSWKPHTTAMIWNMFRKFFFQLSWRYAKKIPTVKSDNDIATWVTPLITKNRIIIFILSPIIIFFWLTYTSKNYFFLPPSVSVTESDKVSWNPHVHLIQWPLIRWLVFGIRLIMVNFVLEDWSRTLLIFSVVEKKIGKMCDYIRSVVMHRKKDNEFFLMKLK